MQRGPIHRSTESVHFQEQLSLDSLPSTINGSSYPLPEAKSPQERLIASLLPSNSGRTILELETDTALQHLVETLVDTGKERLDRVAWALSETLHGLLQLTPTTQASIPELMSILYILKILCVTMARNWDYAVTTALQGRNKTVQDRVWNHIDPPEIDKPVATYILSVIVQVLRRFKVVINRPRVGGHTRTGTFSDLEVYNLRGGREDTTRSSNSMYPFTAYRFDHVFRTKDVDRGIRQRPPHEQIPDSAFDIIASSFHHTKAPETYHWLIQSFASRVVWQLSASNWTVVLLKIQKTIRHYAAPQVEDREHIVDLNLIKYSALTRVKLIAIMQELVSLLINMPQEVWTVVARALRSALRNWSRFSPQEFHDVIAEKIRFDGNSERLYERFLTLSKQDPSYKWTTWPVLVTLLAVSPERLLTASSAEYDRVSNFLVAMTGSMVRPPTAITELATGCLVDFCKAAATLSPTLHASPLYSYASDISVELLDFYVRPGESLDDTFLNWTRKINVALMCDILFVTYRYHHDKAAAIFARCLDINSADAVKLSAIDALTTVVVESRKYPWFQPISTMYQFAPKIRQMFALAIQQRGDGKPVKDLMSRSNLGVVDDWTTDPSLNERDHLILSIMTLQRLDPGMFVSGLEGQGTMADDLASLMHPRTHYALRLSMAITCQGNMLSILTEMLDKDRPVETPEAMRIAIILNPPMTKAILSHFFEEESLLPIIDPLDMINVHGMVGWAIYNETHANARGITNTAFFDYIVTATEIIALIHLAYFETEFLNMSCEMLGLIARAEDLGVTYLNRYFSEEQGQERLELYREFYRCSQDAMNAEVQHKRIRAAIRRLAFPNHVYVAAWREVHGHWTRLLEKIRLKGGFAESAKSPDLVELWAQWRNITLFLTSLLACLAEGSRGFPRKHLPQRLQGDVPPFVEMVDGYLDQLVRWVTTDEAQDLNAIALEALSSELSPQFYPRVLYRLDGVISGEFNQPELPPWDKKYKMHITQFTSLLKSIFERLGDLPNMEEPLDLSRMLQCLVRYLDRSSNNISAFNIKAGFVSMVESFLKRDHWLIDRKREFLHNVLLLFISGWMSDSVPYQAIHAQKNHEIIHQLDQACLRCIAILAGKVQLKPVDSLTSAVDTVHVRSRLFHRQLSVFMVVLERWLRNRHLKAGEVDILKLLNPIPADYETSLWAHSVEGITNLLRNNTVAGLSEALSFCYHEEPEIRSIFITIFARAIQNRMDLSSTSVSQVARRFSYLCELIKNPEESHPLALAIIENCPANEVEEKCYLLLNVLNTRALLIPLLKAAIDHEISATESAATLFRSNDMRNILLASFCKKYGSDYLRTTVRSLIDMLSERPDHSYDIDPNVAYRGGDLSQNTKNVLEIAQAFLNRLIGSVDAVPPLIREVCGLLADQVARARPRSGQQLDRQQAIGTFLFLRFISPAIIGPEKIDIELPPSRALSMRRGLVLIAKIIQNLANDSIFRESHLVPLNLFIKENVPAVKNFMNTVARPSPNSPAPDAPLSTPYEEADHIICHQFFASHADAVGQTVLRFRGIFASRRSRRAMDIAKASWDELCSVLVDLGPLPKYPTVTKKSGFEHPRFAEFLMRNANRDITSVENLFVLVPEETNDNEATFLFRLNQVDAEVLEPHALWYHILSMLANETVNETDPKAFKVILDCSKFTFLSDLPVPWIAEFFDVIPFDQLSAIVSLEILNPNRLAREFLRKVQHLVMGFGEVSVDVQVTLSRSERFHETHPQLILDGEAPFEFDLGQDLDFSDAKMLDELDREIDVIVAFEERHLRVINVPKDILVGEIKAQLTEFIDYEHVDDIIRLKNYPDRLMIRRGDDRIVLKTSRCDLMIKCFHIAKARTEHREIPQPFPHPRILEDDTHATLLSIGLVNLCHPISSVRNSTLSLVCALADHVGYSDPLLLDLRNGYMPPHPSAFASYLSERFAACAPSLTLAFISEFRRGYYESRVVQRGQITRKFAAKQASSEDEFRHLIRTGQKYPVMSQGDMKVQRAERLRWHRTTVLMLITPWIHNLRYLADPSHKLFEDSGESLRSATRALIDVTVADGELAQVIFEKVWAEVAKLEPHVLSGPVTGELIDCAIHAGAESQTCHAIAEIFSVISCMSVRAKLLARLRNVVEIANTLTEPRIVTKLTTLARLLAAALFNPRQPLQTPFFVPEICHSIVTLMLLGGVVVRSAVVGMLSNFIHSLLASRVDQPSYQGLLELAKKCSSVEILKCFGLARLAPDDNEYRLIDVPELESVEEVSGILLQAIKLAAPTVGVANTWRARWMSLTTASAFQLNSFVRARGFATLGLVAPEGADEDFFYQIVVSFLAAIEGVVNGEDRVVMNLLRCIQKMIYGNVQTGNKGHLLLWIVFSIMHGAVPPIFKESALLLHGLIAALVAKPGLQGLPLVDIFAYAKAPEELEDKVGQVNFAAGLSYDRSTFSISIATVLFRGMRREETIPATTQLLSLLLQLSASDRENRVIINGRSSLSRDGLGYFLALLPTCVTTARLVELLRLGGASSAWATSFEGDHEHPRLAFEALGITDEDSAVIAITFIIMILRTAGGEREQELLFNLLAQAGEVYPETLVLASDALLEIVTQSFEDMTNRDLMTNAAIVSSIATRNAPTWGAAAPTRHMSSNSLNSPRSSRNLRHANSVATVSSRAPTTHHEYLDAGNHAGLNGTSSIGSNEHRARLEELGMPGVLNRHQFLPEETSMTFIAWITALVDAVKSSY
ncbi:hypothetical protein DL93DRAFT_2173457 [Clavulina sp. PMI_390]|nr:hypothetical protein DL93DRAFT_2173457 [Clavulina sp. PMI_390]